MRVPPLVLGDPLEPYAHAGVLDLLHGLTIDGLLA
jgi:hypothetical protein